MPSRFAQLFQRTGARNILRQFGETITYYPKGSSLVGMSNDCDSVEMQAKVDRQGVSTIPELDGFPTDSFIVSILNHEDDGRLAEDIDDTGDEIGVAPQIGLEPIRKQVVRILASEPGMVRLLVR